MARAGVRRARPRAEAQSYLFYLAWFVHNANSMLSTGDAHGAVFRGYALFSCSSLDDPDARDLLATTFGLAGTCPSGEGER